MNATHDIEDAFWFLSVKLGYQRFRSEYFPAHFGNAVVEYRSPDLRVQVTKDHGHFLCDFAPAREPVEWFDLDIVLRDLGENRRQTISSRSRGRPWNPSLSVSNRTSTAFTSSSTRMLTQSAERS